MRERLVARRTATVVSLDHGCGAHSETRAPDPEPEPMGEPVIDEWALEFV